jgi:hypothetical protein
LDSKPIGVLISEMAISEIFALRGRLLPESCLADLVYYFRSQPTTPGLQRCRAIY